MTAPNVANSASEPLGRVTASGTIWSVSANIFVQIAMLISTVVVARYLQPDEFGVAALAMVIIAFANVFSKFGLGPAIVTGRLEGQLPILSAHWLICILGAGLCIAIFLAAPLAGVMFENAKVSEVLMVASLSLAFGACETVPLATLQRENQFRRIALHTTVSQILITVTAVIMVILGAGVWALIIPRLAGLLLRCTLHWIATPLRFELRFSLGSIKSSLREGTHVVGWSLTEFLSRNADNAIIGVFFGVHELGRYAFSYAILTRSLSTISRAAVAPLLSSLGKVRDDLQRLDAAVGRACTIVARSTFPVAVGGAIVAPLMIKVVFGAQWADTTTLVRVFLMLGVVQSLCVLFVPVWLALGKTRLVLLWGLIANIGTIPVFLLGTWIGSVEAVAVCYAIYSGIVLAPFVVIVTQRVCKIRLSGLLPGLLNVVRDVAVMAAATAMTAQFIERVDMPPWLSLVLQVGVGTAAYATSFRVFSEVELSELTDLLPRAIRIVARRLLILHNTTGHTA